MISDHLCGRMVCGRLNADFDQPLVDVLDLLIPQDGSVPIDRIIGKELMVMLEVGAATTGVGDDGVELVWRELLKLLARELLGQFPFAVVRVKRAAAELLRGRDGRNGRNQLGGELGLDVGRDAFELLEAFGQEFENAAPADKVLQPELLVNPQHAAHQPQVAQVHE